MIRRRTNPPKQPSQLRLPFASTAPAAPQIEPITVRIPDAIRMTGLGRSKLYELIASGDIETIKVGRCTLILVASLRQMIDHARNQTT